MKTLTKLELFDLLKNVHGTTFVSIETETTPKLRVGNPFETLKKISKVSGAVGFNYENSVNLQRARENKETDFEPLPRKWGSRLKGTPLVVHKNKPYLEIKVQSADSEYISGTERINIDKVIEWQYNKNTRQNLDNEIILRDYALESIRRIKIKNEEYIIV